MKNEAKETNRWYEVLKMNQKEQRWENEKGLSKDWF